MKFCKTSIRSIFLLIFVIAGFCGNVWAISDRAKTAIDNLKQEYPGVRIYRDFGPPTRIYGAPFSYGSDPQESADLFRDNHFSIFGTEAGELKAFSLRADKQVSQPIMYNRETGEYKFTLFYYAQYRDDIPVFRSELKVLVRHLPGYPAVWAASSLHDLGDFTAADKYDINFDAGRFTVQEEHPALNDFSEPETVIWAGIDDIAADPALALSFTATDGGFEEWLFVTEASTGEILYTENLIIFEDLSGNVSGLATEGYPADFCAEEVSSPLPYVLVEMNGSITTVADDKGDYLFTDVGTSEVSLSSKVWGQYFKVTTEVGEDAELVDTLFPPGPSDFVHNPTNTEFTRAEVNSYIHANVIRDLTLAYNPAYPSVSVETEFPVSVNRNDGYCPGNAWYNGWSINFCRSAGTTPNTGFSTVVHHEYGHHLVSMAGSGQGQYGEGMSDVVGMLVTDDPETGVGFSGSCSQPLRDADNGMLYPCDGEIHYCGTLISGCVWSTRNELIITEPENYLEILRSITINSILLHTGSLITPQITIDFLTLDDDDGNLNNRSPHYTEIDNGFGAHDMEYPEPAHFYTSNLTLSDQTYGNNDGILDAGETIEVTFSVTDNNIQDVSALTATLFFDDASLIIIDGSYDFGTLPSSGTLTNFGDPFEFEIPVDYAPRTDTMFIAFDWICEYGPKSDTLIMEQMIGKVQFLLVDGDDGIEDTDEYFINHLIDNQIPFYEWDIASSGSPDSNLLNQYATVFWFTGDFRPSPLGAADVTAMEGYLDGGGNLFLTGQGIAAQLSTDNPSFLQNYLHSNYLSTSVIPILAGVSGSQVFDITDSLAIAGYGGAGNQSAPDWIQAVNGGVGEFSYYNSTDLGAVSYDDGVSKMLFFSFGFEAIIIGDSRFTYRDSVFIKILEFFEFTLPNSGPEVLSISVAPDEPMNMVNHIPHVSWVYFDRAALTQQTYQVQLGGDQIWRDTPFWDSGPVTGSESSADYVGPELFDGERYYVRVRVNNGNLWSGWGELMIRYNNVPSIPAGLAPDDFGMEADNPPQLTHQNAMDPEFDELLYDYEIYEDSLMVSLVSQESGYPEDLGEETTWQSSVVLTENDIYYWRARSDDQFEKSEWSEIARFWINAVNLPPNDFNLIYPDSGAIIVETSPLFSWSISTDDDLLDSVFYEFQYSVDPSFNTYMNKSVHDSTATTPVFPLEFGTVYYWRVKAYDLFGGSTFSSKIYSVTSEPDFLCGDANDDGGVNLGDGGFIVNYIFFDGPAPSPYEAADVNNDGTVNLGDSGYLINYIFYDGPPPDCY